MQRPWGHKEHYWWRNCVILNKPIFSSLSLTYTVCEMGMIAEPQRTYLSRLWVGVLRTHFKTYFFILWVVDLSPCAKDPCASLCVLGMITCVKVKHTKGLQGL